jgi:hypothetical protein
MMACAMPVERLRLAQQSQHCVAAAAEVHGRHGCHAEAGECEASEPESGGKPKSVPSVKLLFGQLGDVIRYLAWSAA